MSEIINISRNDLTQQAIQRLDGRFQKLTGDPEFWIDTIKMPVSCVCDKNGMIRWEGDGGDV